MNVTVLKKEEVFQFIFSNLINCFAFRHGLHQIHIASHYKVVYCISFSCPASAAQTENLLVFMS